ncbi:hypothetical protein TNIN_459811 [Trichonephila inaurata madagascariensis]|uniref:Uncharacterized protein n=1 Tax=Trichonephila inaurata madagascariensis TaxID=2747483 RepID=A0A8X6WZ63_9ARAC|nr:hypothetical protein TNIN_459811 [Trichonephila inaurata madagascariensis]
MKKISFSPGNLLFAKNVVPFHHKESCQTSTVETLEARFSCVLFRRNMALLCISQVLVFGNPDLPRKFLNTLGSFGSTPRDSRVTQKFMGFIVRQSQLFSSALQERRHTARAAVL